MTSVAIIPARAGSKRLPGKNKRLFLGKPLIHWTIEAALKSRSITKVIVTTDDEDILNYSSKFKDAIFLKRDVELSSDTATSAEVVIDAMQRFGEGFNNFVLLQPTSPLRDSSFIDQAFEMLEQYRAKQLIAVRACEEVLGHIVIENNGYVRKLFPENPVGPNERALAINGAIYISDWPLFMHTKSFLTEYTQAFEMPTTNSVDIDTEEDWKKAEELGRILKWT